MEPIEPSEFVPPADTEDATPARFANAPKLTDAEVNESLEDARTIAQAWTLAEDANSMELLRQTYRSLAGLGEAVTFAGADSEMDESEAVGVLKSLTDNEKKLTLLGKAGEVWLRSSRDSAGVLLLGAVKGIEQQGDLYETKLAVSAEGKPVSLYSDSDPADLYQVDSDVLILGAIIDDPAANLTGYQGDAESVVWCRLSVVVSE